MSAEDQPEPLLCANCGRPLVDPFAPCPQCQGPDGRPDPPGAMETFRLARRARAQLLFGVNSWPFALLAAWTANRGLAREASSTDPDPRMQRRFRRMIKLAFFFAGLAFAYYLFVALASS